MIHQQINSSMISSVAHDGDILHVTFKGGKTYEYKDVSAEQFQGLLNAESFGKHLNSLKIKGSLFVPKKEEKD